jgi:hypothetical protein
MKLEDVQKGLKQIQAKTFDGSPFKIGLKREEVDKYHRRIIDGYSVCIHAPDRVLIFYSSECKITDVHKKNKFESDAHDMVDKIKKFLKKEFKEETGKALRLKQIKKHDVSVEYVSQVVCHFKTAIEYKVSVEGSTFEDEDLERSREGMKEFLSLGGWKEFVQGKKDDKDKDKK